MSHFLVVVLVRPSVPDRQAEVARLLAPFHEFECTGRDDEYVKEIDRTAEALAEYAKDTNRCVVLPSGEKISAYDDRFYRDPTPEETAKIGPIAGTGCGSGLAWTSKDWGDGRGYRTKIHNAPADLTVDVPVSEQETFTEWCNGWYGWDTVAHGEKPDLAGKHKYGYIVLDENGHAVRCIDRTNPNAKWDWWVVGGRWTGVFNNDDPTKNPKNYEPCIFCGATGSRSDFDYSGPSGDWARAGNGPFRCKGRGCNACYGSGMSLKHAPEFERSGDTCPVAELPDEGHGFAVLTPDGEWIERGTMGWWGAVHDEKDEEAWKAARKTVFTKYRDCIAVAVDCHI